MHVYLQVDTYFLRILYLPGATCSMAKLTTSKKSPTFSTRSRYLAGGNVAMFAISSIPLMCWFPTAITKTSTPLSFNF